jgi:hypothetical protein
MVKSKNRVAESVNGKAASHPETGEPTSGIMVPPTECGLVAIGTIQRRTRRVVGENHITVVIYTLGPSGVVVEDWDPPEVRPIGARVVLPIDPGTYQGRVVLRVSRQEVF